MFVPGRALTVLLVACITCLPAVLVRGVLPKDFHDTRSSLRSASNDLDLEFSDTNHGEVTNTDQQVLYINHGGGATSSIRRNLVVPPSFTPHVSGYPNPLFDNGFTADPPNSNDAVGDGGGSPPHNHQNQHHSQNEHDSVGFFPQGGDIMRNVPGEFQRRAGNNNGAAGSADNDNGPHNLPPPPPPPPPIGLPFHHPPQPQVWNPPRLSGHVPTGNNQHQNLPPPPPPPAPLLPPGSSASPQNNHPQNQVNPNPYGGPAGGFWGDASPQQFPFFNFFEAPFGPQQPVFQRRRLTLQNVPADVNNNAIGLGYPAYNYYKGEEEAALKWPKIFKFTDGRINLSDFEKDKKIGKVKFSKKDPLFDNIRRDSFLILHGGTYN